MFTWEIQAVTKVNEYVHEFFHQICLLFVDPVPALYFMEETSKSSNCWKNLSSSLQYCSFKVKLLFVHFLLVEVYQLHWKLLCNLVFVYQTWWQIGVELVSPDFTNAWTLNSWVNGLHTTLNVASTYQFFACERILIILSLVKMICRHSSTRTSFWRKSSGMEVSAMANSRSRGSSGHRCLHLRLAFWASWLGAGNDDLGSWETSSLKTFSVSAADAKTFLEVSSLIFFLLWSVVAIPGLGVQICWLEHQMKTLSIWSTLAVHLMFLLRGAHLHFFTPLEVVRGMCQDDLLVKWSAINKKYYFWWVAFGDLPFGELPCWRLARGPYLLWVRRQELRSRSISLWRMTL